MVSIHGPLGYGPSTLPLRHSALLNTLTFYPSRYLCCLKNPIFFRNCKNSIHDCRQIVCAKFQTCNVTRHRFTYPCLPSPWQQTKKEADTSSNWNWIWDFVTPIATRAKKSSKDIFSTSYFSTVSAVKKTELSERKVAVSKQIHFQLSFFSMC